MSKYKTISSYYQNGFILKPFPPYTSTVFILSSCWKQNKEHGSGVLCNYLKTPAFSWQCIWQCLIIPSQFPFQNKKPETPVGTPALQMCPFPSSPFSPTPQQVGRTGNGVPAFAPLHGTVFLPAWAGLEQPWHTEFSWNVKAEGRRRGDAAKDSRPPLRRQMASVQGIPQVWLILCVGVGCRRLTVWDFSVTRRSRAFSLRIWGWGGFQVLWQSGSS